MKDESKLETVINAVTATTTSSAIPVNGAKKIGFRFKRANHSNGSSTFTVEGSLDGSNWIALNNIVSHVTNTNAQTITRVASVALSSNTSVLASLDMQYMTLNYIRVIATIATDGDATADVIYES